MKNALVQINSKLNSKPFDHLCMYPFSFEDDMQALGMESGAIADSRITASSEWSIYHSPKRARLYTKGNDAPWRGAWSSLTKDLNQWLQVDLGKFTPVTHVATQGRNSHSPAQMVTKYKLQFSDDGASFLFYKRQGEYSEAVNKNISTRYCCKIYLLQYFQDFYCSFFFFFFFFTIRTHPKPVNNLFIFIFSLSN